MVQNKTKGESGAVEKSRSETKCHTVSRSRPVLFWPLLRFPVPTWDNWPVIVNNVAECLESLVCTSVGRGLGIQDLPTYETCRSRRASVQDLEQSIVDQDFDC